MNSYLVYRASFYLDAVRRHHGPGRRHAEGQFAKVLGLAVAVGGAVAFFTVDLHRQARLAAKIGQYRWPSAPWAYSISSTRSTTPR